MEQLKKLPNLAFLFMMTLMLFVSGCSFSANITALNPSALSPDPRRVVAGAEMVSGGNQYQLTATRSYKVQATAGSYMGSVQQSTPKGYKVFTTLQGAVFSEAP